MVKTLSEINCSGRKVLLRCDFNVPVKDSVVGDDTRIREALPTIKELLDGGAAVILMSHLGRPKGAPDPALSLKPVAERLSELLGKKVIFCPETSGEVASRMASELSPGEVMVLENLRFTSKEKENDPGFASELASLGDLFVQDAFGTVHREHASMVGVPSLLESAAGRLLEKEIKYLSRGLEPEHPMVLVLGGAKIETKIGVIEFMLDRADIIIIGGGMAYTLLKEKGHSIGRSLFDAENVETARRIIKKAEEKGVDLVLPVDYIVSDSVDSPRSIDKTQGADIPDELMGVDIGEKTRELFDSKIRQTRTVVLNGPMGVFEISEFSEGTKAVLKSIAGATAAGASTIAGGGDTVAAINGLGFSREDFTHVSTGGGASLKFLEGRELPGIKVLG